MWWESNYQRAGLATFPDPAICTFGCWNRLVLWGAYMCIYVNYMHVHSKDCCYNTFKDWPRLLYSRLNTLLINENAIIIPLQKVMQVSHFEFGFQCLGVFQVHCGVQKHLETDHYFILLLFFLYICSSNSVTGWGRCCIIKLRWSLFSCSTWRQLQSGWKLKIQMLLYSLVLSKYERRR